MIAQWMEQAGLVGLVIAALAVVSLHLYVFGVIYMWWMRGRLSQLRPLFGTLDADKRDVVLRNPLGGVIWCALVNRTSLVNLEAEVAYLFQRNLKGVFAALTGLSLIVGIAPLLGLLGTVIGITHVFNEMALEVSVNQSMLAGGIGEALVTTIMGLTVAVPSLIFQCGTRLQMRTLMFCCMEEARGVIREAVC